MAARDLDAVFFVKDMPDIWFDDGHFHVAYDVGKRSRFEFVFSPNNFLKMRAKAATIVDEFHETTKVVPMRGRRKNTQPTH